MPETEAWSAEKLIATESVSLAADGERIMVLGNSVDQYREIFLQAIEGLQEFCASMGIEVRIRRSHGDEGIEFPQQGGRVSFHSTRGKGQSARGWSADRVYIPFGQSEEVVAAVLPCLATVRRGMLVQYGVNAR